MNRKIILASSSPRRKKILEDMNLDFKIITSNYDEFLENSDFTYKKIEELAYNKAKSVLDIVLVSHIDSNNMLILSADTVVVLNGEILGKPQNKLDAINMLKKLSGHKHSVVTSICVIDSANFQKQILSTTSFVEFNILSDELIMNYIETYRPLDKAGSYGIQELPQGFVNKVEGSFENIIGLCPLAVKEILNYFKI